MSDASPSNQRSAISSANSRRRCRAIAALARDADLQEAGLTSMATVKLMLAIEAAYDVAIPDAELTPENFRSIAAIEALLERLKAA